MNSASAFVFGDADAENIGMRKLEDEIQGLKQEMKQKDAISRSKIMHLEKKDTVSRKKIQQLEKKDAISRSNIIKTLKQQANKTNTFLSILKRNGVPKRRLGSTSVSYTHLTLPTN